MTNQGGACRIHHLHFMSSVTFVQKIRGCALKFLTTYSCFQLNRYQFSLCETITWRVFVIKTSIFTTDAVARRLEYYTIDTQSKYWCHYTFDNDCV